MPPWSLSGLSAAGPLQYAHVVTHPSKQYLAYHILPRIIAGWPRHRTMMLRKGPKMRNVVTIDFSAAFIKCWGKFCHRSSRLPLRWAKQETRPAPHSLNPHHEDQCHIPISCQHFQSVTSISTTSTETPLVCDRSCLALSRFSYSTCAASLQIHARQRLPLSPQQSL
jgi:hypothetical protein